MDEHIVSTGKSFEEVIKKTAIRLAGDYLLDHGELMKAAIINCTGQPIDFSSKEVPPECRIYMSAFASGIGNVLTAVLTGKLDLYVMKKEISAGTGEQPAEDPTP